MGITKKGTTAPTLNPSKLKSYRHEQIRRRVEKAVPDLPIEVEDPGVWSARFVIAADGAEQRGLAFPWYMARQKMIHLWHGGRTEVVSIIADLALALLNNNPTMSVDEATLEAGNEFRRSVRGQWDRECGGVDEFDVHIEYVADRIRDAGGDLKDKTEVAVGVLGLVEEHPADIEAPERERVRLLRESLDELTPLQRKAAMLRSGGMTYRAIAEELGMNAREQAFAACQRAFKNIKNYIEEREQAA